VTCNLERNDCPVCGGPDAEGIEPGTPCSECGWFADDYEPGDDHDAAGTASLLVSDAEDGEGRFARWAKTATPGQIANAIMQALAKKPAHAALYLARILRVPDREVQADFARLQAAKERRLAQAMQNHL